MTDSFNNNLEEKIKAKVEEVKRYASDIPGVIIIHDLRDSSLVWMSPNGLKALGVTLEELTGVRSEEYHARFFNPEDAKDYAPKIFALMERNQDDESCSYFQQVRVSNNADWIWHMGSTKILLRNDAGKPILIISVSNRIDTMHHMTSKANRILEENNFLRKHYPDFAKLSAREKQILRLSALGKTSPEVAQELNISVATVDTHRKNIRLKLKANSFYDLNMYARAFDLI